MSATPCEHREKLSPRGSCVVCGAYWPKEERVVATYDCRTVSENNSREHWATKAKRVQAHRHGACLVTRATLRLPLPVVVTLVRIAPRTLDDDNLRGALKATRDGVADAFGVNDRDPRVEWRYEQRRGGARGLPGRDTGPGSRGGQRCVLSQRRGSNRYATSRSLQWGRDVATRRPRMNHAGMDKAMAALGCVWLMACGGDPARFRPAKGSESFPAAKTAYRVEAPNDGCDALGVVIEAESIEDIAATAANHGGTHYRVMDDFGGTSIETTSSATHVGWGSYVGRSTSREVKHHWYTAQVYRCP